MRRFLTLFLLLFLVGCGGPPSTEDWLQQLKHPDVVKRREAIRELGARIADDERITPALVEALHDENRYVRRDAAVTLAKLGPAAKSAVPALAAALKDKQRGVRKAAAQSLRKIDPKGVPRAG